MICVQGMYTAYTLLKLQSDNCLQKGQTELLISSLPGFPDGLSLSEDGNFWVTLAGPNQPFVKILPYRYNGKTPNRIRE